MPTTPRATARSCGAASPNRATARRWCPRRSAASDSAWPRLALIAEQIGHTLAPTPFFSTAVLAAWLLKTAGSPEQQKAWLPRIAAADVVMALAVDEQSRHRPDIAQDQRRARRRRLAHRWPEAARAGRPCGRRADRRGARRGRHCTAARAQRHARLENRAHGDGRRAQRRARRASRRARAGRRADRHDRNRRGACSRALLDVGRVVAAAELLGLADEVFERTVRVPEGAQAVRSRRSASSRRCSTAPPSCSATSN